jgi:hypothetical protein
MSKMGAPTEQSLSHHWKFPKAHAGWRFAHGFKRVNKNNSYKIMKMEMFATLEKANLNRGNIRGLNLAAVKHMTTQVTRLLL